MKLSKNMKDTNRPLVNLIEMGSTDIAALLFEDGAVLSNGQACLQTLHGHKNYSLFVSPFVTLATNYPWLI